MSTSRALLSKDIIVVENRLNSQQARVIRHKNYFIKWVRDNRSVLALAVIPFFIWGWRRGLRKRFFQRLSKLLNLSLILALKFVGKSLVNGR
jgi:hypothetical protein